MPWCPSCKLEYVAGVKVCPDCKEALVDSLEEAEVVDLTEEEFQQEFEDTMYKMADDTDSAEEYLEKNPIVLEMIQTLRSKGLTEDEIKEIMKGIQERAVNAAGTYNLVSDKYNEHKSGALVLVLCGLIGIVVILLSALGIINLPLRGYTLYLSYGVMGALFLIFLISGLMSFKTVKKLAPLVKEEEENIAKLVEFLKAKKAEGAFSFDTEGMTMEEANLFKSNLAVQTCERTFSNLAPGFSFYVTDRYYSEIFGEEDYSPADVEITDDGAQV